MSESTKEKKQDGFLSMLKLGAILAAYAVVACTVLAVVNNVTDPIITEKNIRKANEAMKAVFPEADTFEAPAVKCGTTKSGKTVIDAINLAKKDGQILGAVTQISGPTYDRSTIMVGMDTSGKVTGMRYLSNSDTPSFGQKASSPTYKVKSGESFYGQFTGKNAADGFVIGKTFDAISGATITSNGIAVMMEDACDAMFQCLSAEGGE